MFAQPGLLSLTAQFFLATFALTVSHPIALIQGILVRMPKIPLSYLTQQQT